MVLGWFLAGGIGHAKVSVSALFSDHMVLQQGKPLPVWGTAEPGEKITVALDDQSVSTTADAAGDWKVVLEPLRADGVAKVLRIEGTNTIEIQDVLLGEVWVCSGQSNMERDLGPSGGQPLIVDWEKERDAATYPQIRQFKVAHHRSLAPAAEVRGQWTVCSPGTVPGFSAVGYFFARDLHARLKVPVGILFSAVGGTRAELWTRREVLEEDPAFRQGVADFDQLREAHPAMLESYRQAEPRLQEEWEAAVEGARAAGAKEPAQPKPPVDPLHTNQAASVLYNGMIAPLQPYPIRGVAWYQGESNASSAKDYAHLSERMIRDWREQWGLGNFPFLFVQIAPFKGMPPEIRDAQLQAWKQIENTAMVVTTDCGDADDIHPARKRPVGERLALAARALAYREKIEYSGPRFESMEVRGGRAILSFDHVGGGLIASGGSLRGFEISADGKIFVPGEATIVSNRVEVSAASVPQPKAVRYGWANSPDVNLANREGLPASPFRTDVP